MGSASRAEGKREKRPARAPRHLHNWLHSKKVMNATKLPAPQFLAPTSTPNAGSVTEALAASMASRWRRRFFRLVRLGTAGVLLLSATWLGQRAFNRIESDHAYLNAPITSLRTPIAGTVALEPLEPGTLVVRGTEVFRVENTRFGNLESMSQLNWIRELADRLRAELADAEVRLGRQAEIFKFHQALFEKQLLPQLDYAEQEAKVAFCQTAAAQKKDQLRSAEARLREVEQHLALQKQAVVTMPFEGVVWAVREQNGGDVAAHEPVVQVIDPRRLWVDAFMNEKHAAKFAIGTQVIVRTVDGKAHWNGRVESARAGVGRMSPEALVAVPPTDLSRRRVAVRVRMESARPFSAAEFFGVGRSVVVSLPEPPAASPVNTRVRRTNESGRAGL